MKTVPPDAIGFSSIRLERISSMLQGYVDRNDLAGIIAAVSRRGKTAYYEKFGWMDKEANLPMHDDTLFEIASMTKPVTAVAAMMLYEEGHFNLNTPVWKFIPEFKNVKVYAGEKAGGSLILADPERDITFRHLFTHTSGISYGSDENDPVDREYQKGRKQAELENRNDLVEFAKSIAGLPLAFQPGTQMRYSLSIDILGALVEIISGIPFEKFLEERIFKPLDMTDTFFSVPSEKLKRAAVIYTHQGPENVLKPLKNAATDIRGPVFPSPGAGLLSTVADYGRFCQMLVNGGELDGASILSPKTVSLFSINHAPAEALSNGYFANDLNHAGYGYSLGTRVLTDVSKSGVYGSIGEFGWGGAFSTDFWIDPEEQLYGLIMMQYRSDRDYPIHKQFKQLVYQAMI